MVVQEIVDPFEVLQMENTDQIQGQWSGDSTTLERSRNSKDILEVKNDFFHFISLPNDPHYLLALR